ncbi:MAG: glycosyltransferase family 4 protein [Thermomicrobiales bacterium]
MRVALVNVTTTTKIGGVETFVRQLARFLALRGVDVSIFGGTSMRDDHPAAPGVRIHTTPYIERAQFRRVPLLARQYGATKLLERASYAVGARADLESGDFDIIHIHKPFDFPLAAWLRARTQARVVYSSHGRDFFPGDRRFIGSIDVLTACSRYNAVEVAARYGREMRVVYNGVDTEQFAPQPPDARRWQRLNIQGAPVALWAGRLVRWKGTIDAVRAVALARSPVHLAIAGDGPEEQRLKDAARSLGIAERVHFLGNVPHEDLPALFAASQVVLGTSFANETFGMTLAEASACGRPVIATDFGGFPEVVQNGVTGLLVPPRDPARLASALDGIVDDPVGAAARGEAGRAYVTTQFAWPIVTERVLAAYAEALHAG